MAAKHPFLPIGIFRYRNVICPWQTPRELRAQMKSVTRMLAQVPADRQVVILRLDQPDRVWYPKAEYVWDRKTGTCMRR